VARRIISEALVMGTPSLEIPQWDKAQTIYTFCAEATKTIGGMVTEEVLTRLLTQANPDFLSEASVAAGQVLASDLRFDEVVPEIYSLIPPWG